MTHVPLMMIPRPIVVTTSPPSIATLLTTVVSSGSNCGNPMVCRYTWTISNPDPSYELHIYQRTEGEPLIGSGSGTIATRSCADGSSNSSVWNAGFNSYAPTSTEQITVEGYIEVYHLATKTVIDNESHIMNTLSNMETCAV